MRFAFGGRRTASLASRVRIGLASTLIVPAIITAAATPSRAEPEAAPLWRETWAGADVSSHLWTIYSGVTVAPGGHVHGDGLRLRSVGGYGQYSYTDSAKRKFDATMHFADVLVGYQMRFGELYAKAFIGASLISHDITPSDDQTLVTGADVGVKGALELWLNMGPNGWASLDLSWTAAHDTGAARFRSGYRVWPSVSLGIEGGVNVDAEGELRLKGSLSGTSGSADLLDYGRAGVFVRHEWQGGEASLSAGVLGGSFRGDADSSLDPYVTVNWLKQF